MSQAFIGGEAIGGGLTRGKLRWNYTAVHPRVYIPNHAERTVFLNTVAAWLWTDRRGIITGRAAAALHGAKWVNASTPIEVITEHGRRRAGVIVREQRIGDDEITCIAGMPVTNSVAHCARPGAALTSGQRCRTSRRVSRRHRHYLR
jgi:hypothetical protein